MNIHVSSSPAHLKITQTMIEDFILDPVLGVKVIFGYNLDAFQRVRLKLSWWTPRVMDSSGLSSAKTIGMWFVSNLRALLFPGHVSGVYYPAFETGKRTYALYFNQVAKHSALYRAQLGRERILGLDGKHSAEDKALSKGPSCWVCQYKNDAQIMMPAPGFLQDAKTQAGYRFNDLYIDEWTKIESMGSEGIDQQLVGRTTRDSHNKNHPIFRNHHLFLATAEDTMHPAHARYRTYLKEVQSGNPDYALISYNFKHYSDLEFRDGASFKDKFREDLAMKDMKNNKTRSGYLQEALGFWSKNGKGWYKPEVIEGCHQLGIQRSAEIYCSRREDPKGSTAKYFLGVDPAKAETAKADDGALMVLRSVPLISETSTDVRAYDLSFCYSYRVRKADVGQWSGIVHRKHQHFGFTGIAMDGGGGGIWIQPELAKAEQKIRGISQKVQPIATLEDEQGMIVMADFMLVMFRPRDLRVQQCWPNVPNMRWENLIDIGHQEFREGLTVGIAIPPHYSTLPREKLVAWTEEKRYASENISDPKKGLGAQLLQIFVQTNDDGTTYFTKGSIARIFSSKMRKDFAYAGMMAYARFLMWLRTEDKGDPMADEDAAMVFGN